MIFAAACCSLATPTSAKPDGKAEFRQMRAGEAQQLRSDRAYLLLRLDTTVAKLSADLLRVPTTAELSAYEAARAAAYAKKGKKAAPVDMFVFDYQGRPNLFELSAGKAVASEGKTVLAMAEVTPGEYVLYGIGYSGFLYECLCLGTVGFTAEAGLVTDLGTMIFDSAAKPSAHPELVGEVDLGPSASMDYKLFAVALRPKRPGDILPPSIDAARLRPANLHAVGPYPEAGTTLINRLAPIPGVLAYEEGRVIDVSSGREAPPR
jgi:hypothetical protein